MSAYNYTAEEKGAVSAANNDIATLTTLFTKGTLSQAALIAAIAEANAVKATPKDALAIVELADGGHITFKISDKQAISAYGVGGKWPTTLYAAGWLRLIEALRKTDLAALIETNRAKLAWKVKEEKPAE